MATGETVAEKIADINASKAALIAAIAAKGVTVPDGAKLADLAALIKTIPQEVTGYTQYEDDPDFWKGVRHLTEATVSGSAPYGIYANAENLTSLNVSAGAYDIIQPYAFYRCRNVTTFNTLLGAREIGEYAFYELGAQSKPNLNLETSSKTIRNNAFAYSSIESLYIRACHSIGEYAFSYIDNLKNLKLRGPGLSIGSYAFYNCNSLQSVTGSSMTNSRIGKYAFAGCDLLTSVDFGGSTISSVEQNAFYGTAIETINAVFVSLKTRAFYMSSVTHLCVSEYANTYGYIVIEDGAFEGCRKMQYIEIFNASVDSKIGKDAFTGADFPDGFYIDTNTKKEVFTSKSTYPFGLKSGTVIHCTDGDLTV